MAWVAYSSRWMDMRNDSDTDYRAIHIWVSDTLTTIGWAKTADTGQIDLTSATRPGTPTANTIGGYEIRVSSGASTDIYLKISYGNGYNITSPGWWIQTGSGSDGTGLLTGVMTTQRQIGSANGASTTYEGTMYLAGDTDNLVFGAANENNSNNSSIWGVQRTCDSSGVDTNDGWWQYSLGYSGVAQTSHCQNVNFLRGASFTDTGGFGLMDFPRTVTAAGGSNALVYPLFGQDSSDYYPLRDLVALSQGAAVPTTVPGLCTRFTISHYGSNKDYVTAVGTAISTVWGYTSSQNLLAGIRVS